MAPRKGLTGYQGIFLALTLVVMLVVILMSRDLTTSILIIGLITNFLIISSQLTLIGDRHFEDRRKELDPSSLSDSPAFDASSAVSGGQDTIAALGTFEVGRSRDRFTATTTPAPGPAPISLVGSMPQPEPNLTPVYPGAIDDDVAFPGAPGGSATDASRGDETQYDTAAALGHRDLRAGDNAAMPRGNPFQTSRIKPTIAASPCNDDEAIVALDGDEAMAVQGYSRNDPTRVEAGIFRRKSMMKRYVNEELDEAQDSRWWGLHEW
jgi:hypothetical protein